MTEFLHGPIARGILVGLISAAAVDFKVFLGFHEWSDFRSFDLSTASYRWFLGAVTGGLSAAGLGWVLA